jgi:hypothetical protein
MADGSAPLKRRPQRERCQDTDRARGFRRIPGLGRSCRVVATVGGVDPAERRPHVHAQMNLDVADDVKEPKTISPFRAAALLRRVRAAAPAATGVIALRPTAVKRVRAAPVS